MQSFRILCAQHGVFPPSLAVYGGIASFAELAFATAPGDWGLEVTGERNLAQYEGFADLVRVRTAGAQLCS